MSVDYKKIKKNTTSARREREFKVKIFRRHWMEYVFAKKFSFTTWVPGFKGYNKPHESTLLSIKRDYVFIH